MVFGAAFLINDEIARGLSSADDISIQFGVSLPLREFISSKCRRDSPPASRFGS
jgi:hypothetical protein